MGSVPTTFLSVLCAAVTVAAQEPPAPFTVEVAAVGEDGTLRLKDGRTVRLQGLSLPSHAVRPAGFGAALRAFLEARTKARVRVEPDAGGDPLVATVRPERGGPSLNEAALRAGRAVLACRTARVGELGRLLDAARSAQRTRAGWFAASARRKLETLPYLNGAVLGLHHQDSKWDYHRQLDELAAAGFDHCCLLFSVFVDRVDSVAIRRDHPRTVQDPRLIETIGYARSKGMSVMLLPIVLILEPGDDDWRGVLRPRDEAQWWQGYDRFLAHYLDIAEHTGVDLFSVGSELGSLEDRTETWKRLVQNARGRFGGFLTYSANWDHGHVADFFQALDVVGMTAYFSLTKKKDPTVDELVVEWHRVAAELRKLQARHRRPVIFTELGYASQDGINRDPWNYTMDQDAIDLQEQVDCFAAFRRAAPELEFLRGAYLYDFYDEGGAGDWSYSPRGKPAMEQWKAWARYRPPAPPRRDR